MADIERCGLKPPADAHCGPGCCCILNAKHTSAHQPLCGAKWAGSIVLKAHDGAATVEPAARPSPAPPAGPRLNKTQVGKIHAALVEFGYSKLTFKETEDAVNRVLAGTDKRGDIIDMMVRSTLEEAKLVEPKCAHCGWAAHDDQVCAVQDGGFVCMKKPKHRDDHVACTAAKHNVKTWPNEAMVRKGKG